jgi:esterase/lipase
MAEINTDLIHQAYLNAATRYPLIGDLTCGQLDNMRANLQAEIDEVVRKRAAGAMSVANSERWIEGFTQWLQEITSRFNNSDCQEQQTQQAQQQAINNNLQVLQSAANLASQTTASSKAATYIIWGMLGLVLVVSGIVFYKKMKSKNHG